jgi:hypothetical protein
MLQLGVILVAVALLFGLTTLAFGVAGRLGHPFRVALALGAALVVGIALLLE